jgi:hypothetical protein
MHKLQVQTLIIIAVQVYGVQGPDQAQLCDVTIHIPANNGNKET